MFFCFWFFNLSRGNFLDALLSYNAHLLQFTCLKYAASLRTFLSLSLPSPPRKPVLTSLYPCSPPTPGSQPTAFCLWICPGGPTLVIADKRILWDVTICVRRFLLGPVPSRWSAWQFVSTPRSFL